MQRSTAIVRGTMAAAALLLGCVGPLSADQPFLIAECQRLAADPDEPNVAEGVAIDQIESVSAVLYCTKALEHENPISTYRYARAHQADGPLQDLHRAFYWYGITSGLAEKFGAWTLFHEEMPEYLQEQINYDELAGIPYEPMDADLAAWYFLKGRQARDPETFLDAANAGDPFAQVMLSSIYGDPRSPHANQGLSREWLDKAAAQNHPTALLWLSEYPEFQGAEGVEMLRRAVDRGNAMAMYVLGLRYRNGRDVEQNREIGDHFIQLAAATGSREAILQLKRDNEVTAPGQAPFRPVSAEDILLGLAALGVLIIVLDDGRGGGEGGQAVFEPESVECLPWVEMRVGNSCVPDPSAFD